MYAILCNNKYMINIGKIILYRKNYHNFSYVFKTHIFYLKKIAIKNF